MNKKQIKRDRQQKNYNKQFNSQKIIRMNNKLDGDFLTHRTQENNKDRCINHLALLQWEQKYCKAQYTAHKLP